MTSMWLALVLNAALSSADPPAPAASAELDHRPGLSIHADPCLELEEAVLLETVELDLGAGVDYLEGAAPGPHDTQILLDCTRDGEAELTILDPLTDTNTTRVVELPPREGRAETLGWAAVALVRATWINLALYPPESGRHGSPARARALRAAQRPRSAWQIGDGFVVRSFLDPRSPRLMLGEQVEVLHRPLRHLAWTADGELAYWRVPVEADGSAGHINTLSISAAPALLGYGEFRSKRPRGLGTVAIYAGAGARIGGVRMRGASFGDSSGFVAYAGPLTTARVSVSLGRFVGLALEAEAGWLLHGPEQPNGVPLSLIGPWVNGVVVIVSSF